MHLSESCGTPGGDHALDGEREKGESEWSDREIRRRGSKQLETVDTNMQTSLSMQTMETSIWVIGSTSKGHGGLSNFTIWTRPWIGHGGLSKGSLDCT